ncbi:unnamed protein product [Cylindrotheca closterium]|uniref:USP domain-containing protein n=1 Tax=Cylindrotheca closterium TaxID=2856 RepID=A0AAD2G098_9STRA|nr:unnamed protein product [Cylindrotheca closterium]
MSNPKTIKKRVVCPFDRVAVSGSSKLAQTNVLEPPKNTTVDVDPKLIYLCGKYKIPWKKVKSIHFLEEDEGFELQSEKHNAVVSSPLGNNWQHCYRLLHKYWQKQLDLRDRKLEEQNQQEEEERRSKRPNKSRGVYSRSSYTTKKSKWLALNENRNNFDESDDEGTFNMTRPKRKALDDEEQEQEQEQSMGEAENEFDSVPVQGDDDHNVEDGDEEEEQNQEQAMEDAVAAVDLAELEKEDKEESSQPEIQDPDTEPEEAPKPPSRKKKLKRKRVHQQDDSDDEMFGAEMTTPNLQSRTVSPHTVARNHFDDDDDDDDDDDENDGAQPVISSKANKTVTPEITSFFPGRKKAKKVDTQQASAPPSVKRNAPPSNFFAPKRSTVASPMPPSSEDCQSTVAASQTPTIVDSQSTVVASQTPTIMDSQSTIIASPESSSSSSKRSLAKAAAAAQVESAKRKITFHKYGGNSSTKKEKSIEEEDPLVDSPPRSLNRTPPFRRKNMLGKRTYGFSQKKLDKASMALETANVNQSPIRHNLTSALLLSPGRKKRSTMNDSLATLSPSRGRTPSRSPLASSPPPLPMPDFRGIKNIGNTCYMNASLQMLYSVPSFLEQLASGGKLPKHSVVSSIVELFQDLQQVKRTSASARDIKMAVDDKTNKFRGYQQRDANEFLGDLLDTMHEELVDAETAAEKEVKNKGDYPTDNFFRLDVAVCLKCKSCGYTRTKEEMYRYLSLDILQKEGDESSKPNVEQCLEEFFKPEDREIKCEKCDEGLVAEQTMKVLSRPKAILLHLKRFAMVEQPRKDGETTPSFVLRKNKAPLELTKSLSLDPFFGKEDSQEGQTEAAASKQEYKIQSIVHHIGTSAESGHYTADALRKDPKDDSGKGKTWVSFDDTMVEQVSEADVLEDKPRRKTAYMMLYTLGP